MGEKKAIVAGHICIDIIPVFSGKEEKEIAVSYTHLTLPTKLEV